MAVMAWDVGIKNLAYCVLDPDTDVLDWDIINISGCAKLQCCGKSKAGKVCGKAASFYLDEDHGYCKTHVSQSEAIWNTEILNSLFQECTGICSYVNGKGVACKAKAKIKHDAPLCMTHYKATHKRIQTERGLKPVKKKVEGKQPTQDLQINLFKILDERLPRFIDYHIEEVYIENQPSYVNPKMKALACSLMDYFLIRSVIDNKINIRTVQFVSPNTKLTMIPDAKAQIKAAKDKYAITKKLTVDFTAELLADKPEQLARFYAFKPKLDDAADAYQFAYQAIKKK